MTEGHKPEIVNLRRRLALYLIAATFFGALISIMGFIYAWKWHLLVEGKDMFIGINPVRWEWIANFLVICGIPGAMFGLLIGWFRLPSIKRSMISEQGIAARDTKILELDDEIVKANAETVDKGEEIAKLKSALTTLKHESAGNMQVLAHIKELKDYLMQLPEASDADLAARITTLKEELTAALERADNNGQELVDVKKHVTDLQQDLAIANELSRDFDITKAELAKASDDSDTDPGSTPPPIPPDREPTAS